MVVRVGGSFAYLAGDGMLTFDDHVRTVGDLRSAIERTTNIPGTKQVWSACVHTHCACFDPFALAATSSSNSSSNRSSVRVGIHCVYVAAKKSVCEVYVLLSAAAAHTAAIPPHVYSRLTWRHHISTFATVHRQQ